MNNKKVLDWLFGHIFSSVKLVERQSNLKYLYEWWRRRNDEREELNTPKDIFLESVLLLFTMKIITASKKINKKLIIICSRI